MPWIRLKRENCGFGRDDGPPASIRLGWFSLSWWRGELEELVGKMETVIKTMEKSLQKAAEELRR